MPKEVQQNKDDETKDRTIFLSGLSYETTEETLHEYFDVYGEIEKLNLPKYQDSQNNIGYCHITFTDSESAKNALEMNGKVVDNRYLEIEMARGARSFATQEDVDSIVSRTVFVKNLPYECAEDEVGDFFSSCGEILEVRLVYHPVQKYFKGFGYIDFKNVSGAKNAVAMSGKMYRGRPLRIDSETRKPKNSYKHKLDTEGGNERYNKDKINTI